MTAKTAQNPLILNYHRLMEAFAKSDDERDFFLDRREGFLIYVDLDKNQKELDLLESELSKNADRYCLIPKLTLYETKKIMEGFANEKVVDIDTKEKLIDIIQSEKAREHFLEFIYDHHTELEKWQQYYQERFRIRIVEWLRDHEYQFVFEEDLDLSKSAIEKLKKYLFQVKVPKDVANSRQILQAKSKTYYSNEALNPRPKRGRPPKQVTKVTVEPKHTEDIYVTVSPEIRPFLFTPNIANPSSVTFSAKFSTEEELISSFKTSPQTFSNAKLEALNERLESLRKLSKKFSGTEIGATPQENANEHLPLKKSLKSPLIKKQEKAKVSSTTTPATKKRALKKTPAKKATEKTIKPKKTPLKAKTKRPALKKLKTIKPKK